MSSLPSGTVTFLFTDIEGSTKLARAHPETWEAARARHHAILREAIETNNGYIFQIIGDAFCGAFHNSGNALKAATQAQQKLKNEAWNDAVIRVRMGIHTGEGELQEDGQYQGYITLSLVQRIMSAGHGGQVLISGATENLLRGGLPEDVDLLDMGRHNFKDVPQAVRVFQVNAVDLQRDFPPLRTFDILPNNLPSQLTSFVGREKELADVKKGMDFIQNDYEDIKISMKNQSSTIDDLNLEVRKQQTENKMLKERVRQLQSQVSLIDTKSRAKNLIFENIPTATTRGPNSKENVEVTLRDFFRQSPAEPS